MYSWLTFCVYQLLTFPQLYRSLTHLVYIKYVTTCWETHWKKEWKKKTYNKNMFRWTISRDRPEKACLSRPWRCKAESVGTSLQPSFNAKMTMNIKINSVGIFELASWLNVSPRAIGPWLPNKYLLLLFTVSIECWIFCLFKMPLTFILSHHLNQAACLWQCGHHETNTLSPIDI